MKNLEKYFNKLKWASRYKSNIPILGKIAYATILLIKEVSQID
jgi:hypothetical protein